MSQASNRKIIAAARMFGVEPIELARRMTKEERVLGDYAPADVWQVRMNGVMYDNPGTIGLFFTGFETATTYDYRVSHALAKEAVRTYSGSGGEVREAEFGCGWGNLGEAYLTGILGLDPGLYGRMRLTLTDYSHELLRACEYNTQLMPHVRSGRAGIRRIDAIRDLGQLAPLDGAFSHELGDDLGTTTMVLRGGRFLELNLRPVLKAGQVVAELETRDKLVLGDPGKLAKLMEEKDWEGLKRFEMGFQKGIRYDSEYKEVDWERIPRGEVVKEFIGRMGEGVLVGVCVGFAKHLERLHEVLKKGGRYRFFDYGWGTEEDVLREQYPQTRQSAEGHITSDMNFPLVLKVAEAIGFKVVEFRTQQEFVSRAFGEPAILAHTILRAHAGFREGDARSVNALLDIVRQTVIGHYGGPLRSVKARRYIEYKGREKMGKTPEGVEADVDLAQRLSLFAQHKADNISLACYLLRGEIEPAYEALGRHGFDTGKIKDWLSEDPFTRPMKYVVLEKT